VARKPLRWRVVKGDITELAVDAIVNAANNHFVMGAGVAGALKRRGGKVIEEEAVRQGPQPVGAAVVTSAGTLDARYVIHAAVMGMDFQTDAEQIQQAMRATLARAQELQLRTIAFPALGTGVGRFPMQTCAELMVQAIRQETPQTLEEVTFAVLTDEAQRAFEQAIRLTTVSPHGSS